MEQVLNGAQRRTKILSMLRQSEKPLSGAAIGNETGVSRQVVVQDIALLRTEGNEIIATPRGYVLKESDQPVRIFKVRHMDDRTEEELNAIVDLGGCIIDVMVNHRAYGKVTAPLNIRSRRDVRAFIEQIKTGKSTPLSQVTSGYHFHRVSAESEEILDEIEMALREKGLLTEILPYERDMAEEK